MATGTFLAPFQKRPKLTWDFKLVHMERTYKHFYTTPKMF